jgi:hypothetical protein
MRRASDPDIFGDGGLRAIVVPRPPPVSIPPDAVVPAGTSSEEIAVAPADAESTVETPALFAPVLEPAIAEVAPPLAPSPQPEPEAASADTAAPPPWFAPAATSPEGPETVGPPARPSKSHWGSLLALGALASAVAAVAWWMKGESAPPAPSPPPPATSAILAETPPPAATSASPTPRTAASDDLPPGAEVPPGYGFVEIRAPAGAPVRLDGKVVGSGPSVSVPATPGYHELRVQHQGRDTTQVIEVRAAKMTRVRAALAP